MKLANGNERPDRIHEAFFRTSTTSAEYWQEMEEQLRIMDLHPEWPNYEERRADLVDSYSDYILQHHFNA